MDQGLNRRTFTIENDLIELQVACQFGPRIVSLKNKGGKNLLAELPDFTSQRPDGKLYQFYGGHRLWIAPEDPLLSYGLDDFPVELSQTSQGLLVKKPVEQETGIEKSILIHMEQKKSRVHITHQLTNRNRSAVAYSPWAITQFRTGGVAILPQSVDQTGLLPNRNLVIWPYTDLTSNKICWGNQYLLVRADFQAAFKLGFPNPRGWLGYWQDDTLFIKRSIFEAGSAYYDFGSSSEYYCNKLFVELETLAPIGRINPGETVSHQETWELYDKVKYLQDEKTVQEIILELGIEQ